MWKPTSDFMIIEEFDQKSRIELPGTASDINKTFIILAVGPGHWENGIRIKPDVEVGDRVILNGNIATIPNLNNGNGSAKEFRIARAGDVIAYERTPVLDRQPA